MFWFQRLLFLSFVLTGHFRSSLFGVGECDGDCFKLSFWIGGKVQYRLVPDEQIVYMTTTV